MFSEPKRPCFPSSQTATHSCWVWLLQICRGPVLAEEAGGEGVWGAVMFHAHLRQETLRAWTGWNQEMPGLPKWEPDGQGRGQLWLQLGASMDVQAAALG